MKSASHNGRFKAPTLSALIQCGESGALNSPRAHLDRTKTLENASRHVRVQSEVRGIQRVFDGPGGGYSGGIRGYSRVFV